MYNLCGMGDQSERSNCSTLAVLLFNFTDFIVQSKRIIQLTAYPLTLREIAVLGMFLHSVRYLTLTIAMYTCSAFDGTNDLSLDFAAGQEIPPTFVVLSGDGAKYRGKIGTTILGRSKTKADVVI